MKSEKINMTISTVESPAREKAASTDLKEIAADVVRRAMQGGATAAEAVAMDGSEFSTVVRLGEVETLKESGSKGIGVRVFFGQRAASTYSSDLTLAGVTELVDSALKLAKITSEDPFAGIPDPSQLGKLEGDLGLYYEDVYSLSGAERIEWARRAESAALAVDPRITNSDGGSFSATTGRRALANSRGFAGSYRTSYAGVSAAPLAKDLNGQMQRDGWWSSARSFAHLESPESVGHEAARRTLRRLGARRMPTQRVPIVFAPETARTLVGSVFDAASGDAIWRGASFLAGKLGETIAAPNLTIVDDNTMLLPTGAGGFGSSPFDDEGLPALRTVVLEKGALRNYLLNTYTARKLGMKTTGNAGGAHNLELRSARTQPGDDFVQMLRKLDRGLLVTELIGQGVNVVTGDYSRGATGFWVEGGRIRYAVEEITVAGNLRDMLRGIAAVGADTVIRGGRVSGSVLIENMTVGGS